MNQNVCAEAGPSGFQLYLGYTTKAKGWITLGPCCSLFSWPYPIFLPHIRVLLFLAYGPSLCCRLPFPDSFNPSTGEKTLKKKSISNTTNVTSSLSSFAVSEENFCLEMISHFKMTAGCPQNDNWLSTDITILFLLCKTLVSGGNVRCGVLASSRILPLPPSSQALT